ncbi:MAG: excinuclease ABC subunit UvrC [Candidatus Omnitrophica bacterium]|nr:excinuclease ABC subunit UvrC [Candidatus Omnitrophota bacterium]
MDLKEKIGGFPNSPGVYIMKDKEARVLYVGKAASLRKRVRSYFQSGYKGPKQKALMSKVADIECILTNSEAAALLQEAALIKRLQPRYNVDLKDDKSYPYLRLGIGEEFPRLTIARRCKGDPAGDIDARYFGPYTDVTLLREALKMIRRIFPLRTCAHMPSKECLNYHIGQCVAPCTDKADMITYERIVKRVALFLEAKNEELLKDLLGSMKEASDKRDFEEAARLRNQIDVITRVGEATRPYRKDKALLELKEFLRISAAPRRIEAFDVSNISGTGAVGSMVTFIDGAPDKNGYKRFRIKDVKGPDDYTMMREIVRRRYGNLKEERAESPDLIIVDGGKGHLNCVLDELKALGFSRIPAVGIAKEFELIYLPGQNRPLELARDSQALYLVQRIRDEAHRFAISYHRLLRSKTALHSGLEDIKGLGDAKIKMLLNHFGSLRDLSHASVVQIAEVRGIGEKTATLIKKALRERRPD